MRLPDAEFNPRFYLAMAFNFDSCPERRGSDSTKWHKYASQDIIPCWIADMDFMSPPEVVAAVQQRAAHGVYGYPAQREAVLTAVVNHVRARHGWEIMCQPFSYLLCLVGLFLHIYAIAFNILGHLRNENLAGCLQV